MRREQAPALQYGGKAQRCKFFHTGLDREGICDYYGLQQILPKLFIFRFGFVHSFFKTQP